MKLERLFGVFLGVVFILGLVGCNLEADLEPEVVASMPTPTIHPFFKEVTGDPDISEPGQPAPTLTAVTATTTVTAATAVLPGEDSSQVDDINLQALTGLSASDFVTKTVYDDSLNADWVLLEDEGMVVDLAQTDVVHNGRFAISMTPQDAWQTMYFGLSEDAEESYRQNDVLAISFWLNGGDDYIEMDDLAVTVVGSNDYPFWVPDDESAYYDEEYPFSETVLRHLGFNSAIPPNTWVQVEVYIHELIYDPAYRYITGFYIKNADDFFNTVYVDDINIIKFPDPDAEPTANPESMAGNGAPDIVLTATPTVTPTAAMTVTVEATTAVTATPNAAAEADCIVSPPAGWQPYVIQSGDVVSSLALDRNIEVQTVVSVNCLGPDAVLSVGKEIWLPEQTD